MDDMCESVHQFFMSARNNDSGLQFIVSCVDSGEYLPILDSSINSIQDLLNNLNQTTTSELNYSFNPKIFQPNGTTEQKINGIIQFTSTIVSGVNNAIAEHGGNSSVEVQQELNKVTVGLGIMSNILELVQCSHLQSLVQNIGDSVCGNVLNGLVVIVAMTCLVGVICIVMTIYIILAANRFETILGYTGSRLFVQFIAITQMVLGVVSCITALGGGPWSAIGVGIVNIFIPLLGLIGSAKLIRGMILAYAIGETILLVVEIVFVVVDSLFISVCSQIESCPESTHVGIIISLFYILMSFVPIALGTFSSWHLFRNFHRANTNTKTPSELEPLSAAFREFN